MKTTKTIETYKTEQRAYVGQFALKTSSGRLVRGRSIIAPMGGTIAPRPRLYLTIEAASEAAQNIRGMGHVVPVRLV